jgi:hypothetical protein
MSDQAYDLLGKAVGFGVYICLHKVHGPLLSSPPGEGIVITFAGLEPVSSGSRAVSMRSDFLVLFAVPLISGEELKLLIVKFLFSYLLLVFLGLDVTCKCSFMSTSISSLIRNLRNLPLEPFGLSTAALLASR